MISLGVRVLRPCGRNWAAATGEVKDSPPMMEEGTVPLILNVAGAKFKPPRTSFVTAAVGLQRQDMAANFTSLSFWTGGIDE
jgi:hypothetical protein